MLDKSEAIALLTEARCPLFSVEIQRRLKDLHRTSEGPPPSFRAATELLKLYPDHFADMLLRRTDGYRLTGTVVFTTEDDREFHGIDISIVTRYLRVCYYISSRLWRLPHDEFVKLFEEFQESRRPEELRRSEEEDQKRFFNLPAAIASAKTFDEWLCLPTWTLEEAIALTFQKNPDLVDEARLEHAVQNGRSALLPEYKSFKRYVTRVCDPKILQALTPRAFCQWLNSVDHPQAADALLTSALSHFHITPMGVLRGSKFDDPNREVSKPAVHKMYEIILAMAISKYGFNSNPQDPVAQPSLYSALLKDLNIVGLSIDRKTLTQYLDRAYAHARRKELFNSARVKR